jgi:predicted RNA-binding Zn-ribbon protein involved in translation (DUF1610 family)
MHQTYHCPSCGGPIPPGSKFCPGCGQQLIWQTDAPPSQSLYSCPRCKAAVPFGIRSCQNCGLELAWEDRQTQHSPSSGENRAYRTERGTKRGFLKWAGISILSLLLLFSLCAFGAAFMLKQSVLNPRFMTSEVQKIELADMANDFIAEQGGGSLPEEIGDALSETINRQEPQLKAGLNSSLTAIYDYLLGKREDPRLAMLLKDTFLSTDFLTALIDEVEIAPLAKPIVQAQVAQWIPAGMEFLYDYTDPVVDELLANQEPWIKEQLKKAAEPIADYLLGKTDSFNIVISTMPVIDNLREILRRDITNLPLPQLSGLPPALVEAGFNQFFEEFTRSIPASLEIDESLIGSDVPAGIKAYLAETEDTLKELRDYAGSFRLGYVLLIAFMLLLVLGIVLILRQAKGITRSLGIVFLLCGVIQMVIFGILGNYLDTQIAGLSGMPPQLQAWLGGFVHNALVAWQVLGIGFIAGGIILVAVSFFLSFRQEVKPL